MEGVEAEDGCWCRRVERVLEGKRASKGKPDKTMDADGLQARPGEVPSLLMRIGKGPCSVARGAPCQGWSVLGRGWMWVWAQSDGRWEGLKELAGGGDGWVHGWVHGRMGWRWVDSFSLF